MMGESWESNGYGVSPDVNVALGLELALGLTRLHFCKPTIEQPKLDTFSSDNVAPANLLQQTIYSKIKEKGYKNTIKCFTFQS